MADVSNPGISPLAAPLSGLVSLHAVADAAGPMAGPHVEQLVEAAVDRLRDAVTKRDLALFRGVWHPKALEEHKEDSLQRLFEMVSGFDLGSVHTVEQFSPGSYVARGDGFALFFNDEAGVRLTFVSETKDTPAAP